MFIVRPFILCSGEFGPAVGAFLAACATAEYDGLFSVLCDDVVVFGLEFAWLVVGHEH